MTKDDKKYDCRLCNYYEKLSGLCGVCMKKILDEVEAGKNGNEQKHTEGIE